MTADLVRVPFHDGEIIAVLHDGQPRVAVRHICEAVGIDVRSQLRKLGRKPWSNPITWGGPGMTAPKPGKGAYSPETAADLYDTSRDTILRQIKAGKLAAKKLGTKYSITAQALEAWHNSLPDA